MTLHKAALGRTVLVSSISAIVYGLVAYYLNREFSYSAAMSAALTQALVCGLATILSSNLMEGFYGFYRHKPLKKLLTSASSGLIMLAVSFFSHWVNATPNILETVASAAVLALPYYCIYPVFIERSFHEKT